MAEGKLGKMWSELDEPSNIESCSSLGRGDQGGRKRPILVTLASKQIRDGILGKTRRLKEDRVPYDGVFVKRDVPQCKHREWSEFLSNFEPPPRTDVKWPAGHRSYLRASVNCAAGSLGCGLHVSRHSRAPFLPPCAKL